MSRRVLIDSLAFAREGGSLQGELPVSSLVRVLDMLADPAIDDGATRRLVSAFAQAVGGAGLVWGQALDIAAESATEPLTLHQITRLQAGKTGAFLEKVGDDDHVRAGFEAARQLPEGVIELAAAGRLHPVELP